LFDSLIRLFEESGPVPIVFEWPRQCDYWHKPKVERFFKKYKLKIAELDVCHFGLRSIREGAEEMFLKKLWMFATNIASVHEDFDGRVCPWVTDFHQHDVTCGLNAKHSQYYTESLAMVLHNSIQRLVFSFLLGMMS
jgi:hypothetical protein